MNMTDSQVSRGEGEASVRMSTRGRDMRVSMRWHVHDEQGLWTWVDARANKTMTHVTNTNSGHEQTRVQTRL